MTEIYMITGPKEDTNIEILTACSQVPPREYWITYPDSRRNNVRILRYLIEKNDIHKWVIGLERGKGGYEHIQARIRTSMKWEDLHEALPTCHIDKASDSWDYEKKDGNYTTGEDTKEILKCRFGEPKGEQKEIFKLLKAQNDREVLVWYDKLGNIGKSWLIRHLWEIGKAYYIPPYKNTDKITQMVASQYINHGYRPYIFINIPRSGEWSDELIEALEQIKDGLVVEPRYEAQVIDIWGVKVCICTNSNPSKHLTKLSKDRWVIKETKTPSNRNTKKEFSPPLGGEKEFTEP